MTSPVITPDDGNILPHTSRVFHVGTNGNVKVQLKFGDVATFTDLQAGSIDPMRIDMRVATSPGASSLIKLCRELKACKLV